MGIVSKTDTYSFISIDFAAENPFEHLLRTIKVAGKEKKYYDITALSENYGR